MIKDDYKSKLSDEFHSLIKEIGDVKNLHTDKLNIIDSGFKKFLGLSSKIINSMRQSDVLELLKKNGKIDGNYCLVASALLYEEANIFFDEKKYDDAYFKYTKAFNLILTIKKLDLECELKGSSKVMESIMISLEKFHLPFELKKDVIDYYEISGAYSKAEDITYEITQSNNNDESTWAKERLLTFYNELLKKQNDDLERGNLSREEITEALNDLN
ncbi:MAG: DUF6483 family protein [Clostridium sp.]|nr:DUF6483 family protein [Clostridium sp.]